MTEKPTYIYEGFFESFQEANAVDQGFAGKRWLTALENHLDAVTSAEWDEQLPLDPTLLSVLTVALATSSGPFRIVDVGGGLGATFFWLEKTLGEAFNRINYTVVDLPEVIDHANTLGLQEKHVQLEYSRDIPESECHLVNFGSSLHYFEAPGEIIKAVAGSGVHFLVFSRTPVNQAGTYVTVQKYYESRIPVTVIGSQDLDRWCAGLGFRLMLKSASSAAVLGGAEPFPMQGIPEEFQFTYASDLVYCK